MIGQCSVAAAVALVGVDLLTNQSWNISSKRRVLTGVALVGSTAVNDFSADLYIEDTRVGTFWNTHAGVIAPDSEADTIALGRLYVPPGSKISFVCNINATANPVIARLY